VNELKMNDELKESYANGQGGFENWDFKEEDSAAQSKFSGIHFLGRFCFST